MKEKIQNRARLVVFTATLSIIFSLNLLITGTAFGQQTQDSQTTVSAQDKQVIDAFVKRVKDYVALREGLENKMPKLATKSTPEQIEAHKTAFEETVRAARTGAKAGDIFSPEIAEHIRMTIRDEFKGKERQELRKMVMEADTKGVPLRVNYPYPDDKELTEIPSTLLLKLPPLPKQVKYRFVNRHMLLVDRENGLIVDYMLNAIP